MALSARITEEKFKAKEETFEPTCVEIFLAQKPRSENLLPIFITYCFFLTPLALNIFTLLNALTLTMKNAISVGIYLLLLKLFPIAHYVFR